MTRIFMVLAVAARMAAMVAAMATPAFAKVAHLSEDNLEGTYTLGGDPCEPKGVITPSGNTNLQ